MVKITSTHQLSLFHINRATVLTYDLAAAACRRQFLKYPDRSDYVVDIARQQCDARTATLRVVRCPQLDRRKRKS